MKKQPTLLEVVFYLCLCAVGSVLTSYAFYLVFIQK